MLYKISTRVRALEMKTMIVRTYKDPTDANKILTDTKPMGWFVLFEESYESLYVGHERPLDLEPGTEVEIIINPKVEHGSKS